MKVITFSGIDGAGKSTQIEALQSHLLELGFYSTIHTFWDDVVIFSRLREHVSLKAFKGDVGVGSPNKPIRRRDKNVTSWYITAIRLFLYSLDALSLRMSVARSSSTGADFVLFDRYIYDELANLPLHRLAVRLYVRLLLRLIPTPDAAFVVDADPEAAHLRKPEYPLEFVRKNRDAYIALSGLTRSLTVLAPLSVEETTARIKEAIVRHCLKTDFDAGNLRSSLPTTSSQAKTSHP